MKPRSVTPLNVNKLEKLSTPRLLSFLHKLQQCEESLVSSDWSIEEISEINGIVFKSSEEWQMQYNLVRSVLAGRPNFEKT
jgi:hypothetical protein